MARSTYPLVCRGGHLELKIEIETWTKPDCTEWFDFRTFETVQFETEPQAEKWFSFGSQYLKPNLTA